jgi:hypothetical protein
MTTHLNSSSWKNDKIDRKELSQLLEIVSISISDFPPDFHIPKTQHDQELYCLAGILVELAFYSIKNENTNGQSNKAGGDLL